MPKVKLVDFTKSMITDSYISWLNDPEIVNYSELRHRKHTKTSCLTYYHSMIASNNQFWAILVDGEHVGNLTAYVDIHNKTADLAIIIGKKKYHRKGIGKEAFGNAIALLSKGKSFRKVTAGCMASNLPMISLMETIGMELDGRRFKYFLHENKEVDAVYYSTSI